jgi:hypothetical protein
MRYHAPHERCSKWPATVAYTVKIGLNLDEYERKKQPDTSPLT